MFVLIVNNLILRIRVINYIFGNVNKLHPLFLWGSVPACKEAVVKGINNIIQGVSLRCIAVVAA